MSRRPRLSVGGREGVGGRALKFLIMGNFKGGEGRRKSGECLDC